jgi:hypothetical protein
MKSIKLKLAEENYYLNQTFKMCYIPYKGPNASKLNIETEEGQNVYEFLQPTVDSTLRASKIVISNDNTKDLKGYPVRVKLPATFQGVPITIVDQNVQPIPFCYETATGECTTDPSQGNGYIWVKADVPANGKTIYYIESGENGATSGGKVFPLYLDFNGNLTISVTCDYKPYFPDQLHSTIRFLDPTGRLTLGYDRNMTVLLRFKWDNDGGGDEDDLPHIINKEDAWEIAINNGGYSVPRGEILIAIKHRSGSSWCWQWVPTGFVVEPGKWYSLAMVFPYQA